MMPDRLLYSTGELSGLTGIPAETLRWWRRTGDGPRYVRLSAKTVRYRADDVHAWMDAHTPDNPQTGGVTA